MLMDHTTHSLQLVSSIPFSRGKKGNDNRIDNQQISLAAEAENGVL